MDWPILDRPALLDDVQHHLARRPFGAVLLTGPSGVGKTTIARCVAERQRDSGLRILEIVGMAELGHAPLAAFARHSADLGLRSDDSARALIAAIGELASSALLVVDDAPLLDPASAAVVYQLVRVLGVPAVLTARTDHDLVGPVERLLHEQVASTIEVPALLGAEIERLLRLRFGAPPRPDDVARLTRQTSGNALLLRDVVVRTERWGGVHRVEAGIELDPIDIPADAAASAGSRVAELEPAQLYVVARAALGAGAPAATVLAGPEHRIASRLVDDGVLAREGDVVRPMHPLVGEAALRRLTDDEHGALVDEVADRLTGTGVAGLRFAALVLRTAAGRPVAGDELGWAVGHAYGQGEYLVAVDLHDRLRAGLCDDGPSGSRAAAWLVQGASALSWLGRLEAADEAFERAREQITSASELALLASCWGAHLAYRRFDVEAALATAAEIGPLLGPAEEALLAPEIRTWRTLAGQIARTESPSDGRRTSQASGAPAVAVRGAIADVMLHAMAGRADGEAAGMLVDLERRHGVLEPHASAMVQLQAYFTLLGRGRGEDARQLVEAQRVTSSVDAAGIWSYTLAIHLMYGGRLGRAAALATLAVDQLGWRDPIGLMGAARALEAVIAVQRGDAAGARSRLDSIPESHRGDPKAAVLLAEAEALLLVAAGEVTAAAERLEQAAEQAHAHGFSLVAAISLGTCLRMGVPERAGALLREMASGVSSELGLYHALCDAATGLADRDPARVLAAACVLDAAGMTVAAIDVLRQAEPMAPPRGAGELRRRLQEARFRMQATCEAVPLHGPGRDGLSDREWEVAGLACARRTSREIAAELGISVRTVDNHLHNIYRTLGVAGRAGLRSALGAE
ncbi:LuxR C-terminal-related transcriptional regulator [Nocardioides daeguensis]|nr:LuxR C-terminal-related transcriptional regulator [Nocardioides daeguensis]MCR1775494.1 LuxR C-terminal-related transcriptional regulator [Nocardioides daeguensis]